MLGCLSRDQLMDAAIQNQLIHLYNPMKYNPDKLNEK